MSKKNKAPYIFDISDFRAGYYTDVPSSQMGYNAALTAKNCEWSDGLAKRKGYQHLASITASSILGGGRFKIENSYQFLAAVKTASGTTEFRLGTSSAALTTLSGLASVSCTLGNGTSSWQFSALDQQIIGVDGSDKPIVIYENASGTVVIDTLEHNDTRDRDADNWVAGQFTGIGFTDDTAGAQSAASTTFALGGTTISSGFYIGCDYTFNRVAFIDTEAQGTATMAYEYYGRATADGALDWQAMTVENRPTWSSVGDHALQWTFPIGSDGSPLMEQIATDTATLDLKYAIRGYLLGTTTASFSCAYSTVHHNQYLSQVFMGSTPDTVVTHKNHVFLGAGNVTHISPATSLKGFRATDYIYCEPGGNILRMVSQADRLVILCEGWLHGVTGNSWSTWGHEDLGPHGSASKWAAVNHGNELFYLGRDGYIRKFDGAVSLPISKHINTDIETFTAASVAMAAFKDKVWIADRATSVVERFDPDTFATDPSGDGRVGFFKCTNYPVQFFWMDEAEGTLYFTNGTNIFQAEALDDYDTTASTATVPIDFEYCSPYNLNRELREDCQIRRVKLLTGLPSSSSYGTTTFGMYKRSQSALTTYTVSLSLPSGSGIYERDFTIPHTIDGKEQALYLRHNSASRFRLIGYSYEVRYRGF